MDGRQSSTFTTTSDNIGINKQLWASAVSFFVVGDLITTYYGIKASHIHEANKIPHMMLHHGGFMYMVTVKILFVVAAFIVWRHLNEKYRVGIPLGLTLLGVVVTVHNILTLA